MFTDQPHYSLETLEVTPTNCMPALKIAPIEAVVKKTAVVAVSPYSLLRILNPVVETVVANAAGRVSVVVESVPHLLAGHRYQLMFDMQLIGVAQSSAEFSIENVPRGTHALWVEVVGSAGVSIERSIAHSIHVQRISLEAKRRMRPCVVPDYGVRPECPLKDKPVPEPDIPFIPFI